MSNWTCANAYDANFLNKKILEKRYCFSIAFLAKAKWISNFKTDGYSIVYFFITKLPFSISSLLLLRVTK